jgi:hypothetical protein
MGLSLVLLGAAITGGTAATSFFEFRASLAWRLAAGTAIGLAALALAGLGLASCFGLHAWTVSLAACLVLTPVVFVRRLPTRRDAVPAGRLGAVALILGTPLLWRIAEQSVSLRPDGLYTGVSHNIGDLPFHLSVISRFALGDNLPPAHPSFAGASFTYPYLADFAAAMFVKAGASPVAVLVWSTFLLCLVFVVLIHRWTFTLTGSGGAALLAPLIALTSGGLGWTRFAQEAWSSDRSLLQFLNGLSHDYTITADGVYRWGNLVTSLLVPQRGLLLGLPIAVLVFQLWWEATDDRPPADIGAKLTAAGIFTGMMPLIHAHGFAVLLGVGFCVALASGHWKRWVPYFVPALVLGLPQIWWITRGTGTHASSFLGWSFGWDHGTQNVAAFWFRNTGLFIPLLLASFCWRGSRSLWSSRFVRFYLPFTLCFVVPNVLRLAPWIWDNIKILIFWFVASVPIVSFVLARLAGQGAIGRLLAGTLVVALTAAGALDLWRVASGGFENRVFETEGIAFAADVSRQTPPSAVILHAPVYNHPVVLSGRQSFMGYAGHVWSHGLNAGGRMADIRHIYAGHRDAEALVKGHGIDFIVVGPRERKELTVDDGFLARQTLVLDHGGYRLYRTNVRP